MTIGVRKKNLLFVMISLLVFGSFSNIDMVMATSVSELSVEMPVDIDCDSSTDGSVTYLSERFYHFKPEKSGYIKLSYTRYNTGKDSSTYYIYDQSAECVAKYANQTQKTESVFLTVTANSDYYILVEYYTENDYTAQSEASASDSGTAAQADFDYSEYTVLFRISMDFYEYENVKSGKNNDINRADELTGDTVYCGMLTYSEDYYKITAEKNSCVTVTFESQNKPVSGYPRWVYTAYDNKMTKLYTLNTDKTCKLTQQYVLKKGQSVYIGLGNKRAANNKLYNISYSVTELDNIETEPNNSFSKAQKVEKGQIIYGTLNEKTEDYYVLQSPATKTIKIEMRLSTTPECPYRLTVYNSRYEAIANVAADIYKAAAVKFIAEKNATYYIKVSHRSTGGMAEFADYGVSFGVMYSLNVDKRK